jgi:hypothetical protein
MDVEAAGIVQHFNLPCLAFQTELHGGNQTGLHGGIQAEMRQEDPIEPAAYALDEEDDESPPEEEDEIVWLKFAPVHAACAAWHVVVNIINLPTYLYVIVPHGPRTGGQRRSEGGQILFQYQFGPHLAARDRQPSPLGAGARADMQGGLGSSLRKLPTEGPYLFRP